MSRLHIPEYTDFLSENTIQAALRHSEPAVGVPDLMIANGLQADFPDIETPQALQMVCDVYEIMAPKLQRILAQRVIDRRFIDEETKACVLRNAAHGRDFHSPNYETVIGRRDSMGRLVVGPHAAPPPARPVRIPDFLQGEHVTLFGPPDTEKMSINAINALHHTLPDEDPIVEELISELGDVPRWGADNEDSKTPIMRNYLKACRNLIGCFDHSLEFTDPKNGKHYALVDEQRAIPIKRIPGLALPDGNHIYKNHPLPLHLFDFVLHMVHNWNRPEALIFYIPKLENEEEAAYLHALIHLVEKQIKAKHPAYVMGSVGLFIVFENPRAIFRIREIADTLFPYFIGGSLGWHDFLASTARLFRFDPNYRIPVKADPNIVINHIKESHDILVKSLAPIGAVCIGGMYGTLYENGNPASFEISIIGYIKDVVAQLKRGLNGFWVAHPNFVRLGLALVSAWRRRERDPSDDSLERLIRSLVDTPEEIDVLLRFVHGPDVDGLPADDPLYLRGVLAADLKESDVISNNDEAEVRYNIFQALQYLADWLCGNGCVALPTLVTNQKGESVFVRIMDDLATTERSRWELWAEVFHGRVTKTQFENLLDDEYAGICVGEPRSGHRIQVPYNTVTAPWYPIAKSVLRQLVLAENPVEFVPQLILRHTLEFARTEVCAVDTQN
ncbi:MAG: hypothetical protein VXZ96_19765 [Myxococcota bacterium]|nr:hypothetical protein [Myxococcota bacterium]